jgi:hypothetical protein
MNKQIMASLMVVSVLLFGCGIYSQSGASIPPEAKTFSVENIINNAPVVAPTLTQVITERLKTKFINETPLKLTTQEGDFHFSGKIIAYTVAPVAVQGNQTTSVNRLTITLQIEFDNKFDKEKSFKETFSNFADFDASANFATVENDLINRITDGLVQQVFNKAFINW